MASYCRPEPLPLLHITVLQWTGGQFKACGLLAVFRVTVKMLTQIANGR